MTQLEVYKTEGCEIDSQWNHWHFFFDLILSAALWSQGRLACNRHEYHGYLPEGKGGHCVGLTALSHSCVDCLNVLAAWTSWSPKGLPRSVTGYLATATCWIDSAAWKVGEARRKQVTTWTFICTVILFSLPGSSLVVFFFTHRKI